MLLVRCYEHLCPYLVLLLAVCLVVSYCILGFTQNFHSASPAMGKKPEQSVSVVAARLLPHQLVQVLPKLVLVHMVDAPQVHLVTGGEIDLSSLNTKRFSIYLSSQHKDPLKFLVVGSEPLGRLKQLFGIKRRWLVQNEN